jgi:L-ascorbate metabolism protein UlaG (beta-lactamase superfamily)
VIAAAGLVAYFLAYHSARRAIGADSTSARLDRIRKSPQYRDGRFTNTLPRVDAPPLEMLQGWLFGGSSHASPTEPIPIVPRKGADYTKPPVSGLRVTWLGHSTLLLEIDGARLLVDPVWGERASPFSFLGPKRWYKAPLPLDELPDVDAIVFSHDHYDHLDEPTVTALARRPARWIAPLGVGADLEEWGVPPGNVVELDWWEATSIGSLTVTATPARHFSGRWLGDAAQTLWSGWTIVGPRHRVFYSGDTAMHEAFGDIGKRLGPFDLTIIEVGAYDALWADVHLGPEQAVDAHRQVNGGTMLPVHWGLFDLALHGWTEPIQRVMAAAKKAGVRVAAPRPGEFVEPAAWREPVRWWPPTPWRTALEAPIVSSGLVGRAGRPL